jgi:hypothetical protein
MPRKISDAEPTQNSGSPKSSISATLSVDGGHGFSAADRSTEQPLDDGCRRVRGASRILPPHWCARRRSAPRPCSSPLRFGIGRMLQPSIFAHDALAVLVSQRERLAARCASAPRSRPARRSHSSWTFRRAEIAFDAILRAARPLAIFGSVTRDNRMNSSPNVIASQKIWPRSVRLQLRQTASSADARCFVPSIVARPWTCLVNRMMKAITTPSRPVNSQSAKPTSSS